MLEYFDLSFTSRAINGTVPRGNITLFTLDTFDIDAMYT